MGFVGETIEADVATMNPAAIAQGEPDAPGAFTWREKRYEVEAVLKRWKSYKTDRGDTYVDRHWFEVRTKDGEQMRLYFDRRPKTLKRWWLFSTGEMPAPAQRSEDPLDPYLDSEGRLKSYPAKLSTKRRALEYLATKFEPQRRYSEPEVNDLLKRWHTFDDWALLRRDLYDLRFIDRTEDGASYWR